jgi:hypothetical protein
LGGGAGGIAVLAAWSRDEVVLHCERVTEKSQQLGIRAGRHGPHLVYSPEPYLRGLSAYMLTDAIRAQVDAIWIAFGTGGISNPLEVIEQIAYLLLKRLDDVHTLEESEASRLRCSSSGDPI